MSETKRFIFIRFIVYAISLSLVAYVLSIGPVSAVLYDKNSEAINIEREKMARSFYHPLILVVKSNPSLRLYFDEYSDSWIRNF